MNRAKGIKKAGKRERFNLRKTGGRIPLRLPGYFADCYSEAEIREENLLAKASVVRAPRDLE